MADKLQKQRFELKYRIPEHKAQQIRFFVQNYLDCDTYGATQPNLSYPVHSLYIDSSDLRTYNDTINGNRNRYKLRVRYYDLEDSPVYFEIKRRYNKVIRKKRAKVHRWAVDDLLNGHLPLMNHLVDKVPDQYQTLEYFCILQNRLNAKPKMHVTYYREAYERKNSNAVRVTFDRSVRSTPQSDVNLIKKQTGSLPVFRDEVVLELKFSNRFPHWMEECTQLFHLRQESAAKYVDSIIRHKEKKLQLI
jgi:hypothetical protein